MSDSAQARAWRSRYWAELGNRDFAALQAHPDRDAVVAVLPVAAVEQHGPHLPLNVDAVLLDQIVARAVQHLEQAHALVPALFLPAQVVGKSNEHAAFPGTLSLRSETILALWKDIGASVARAGIRKLVLFNTHGGNVAVMDMVARDLREAHRLMVFGVSWFNLPIKALEQFSAQEQRFGIHGGEIETSMMLAARPDLVDMSAAAHFVSASQQRAASYPILGDGKSAKFGWQIQDYHGAGAVGAAGAADAQRGEALLAQAGEKLAGVVVEVSRLPAQTLQNGPLGL